MTVRLQLGSAETQLEGRARILPGATRPRVSSSAPDAVAPPRRDLPRERPGVHPRPRLGERDVGRRARPRPGPQASARRSAGLARSRPARRAVGRRRQRDVMSQEVPAELKALIAARHAATCRYAAAPPAPTGRSGRCVLAHPGGMAYRQQGSNDNGVLLLALPQDTLWCGATIDGYVEFTPTTTRRSRRSPSSSSSSTRRARRPATSGIASSCRQGPWRAENGDVLPLPFQLRVPAGTAARAAT